MKYLLIDGNNLAIRNAFANAELKNRDGIPTGVHFGVFQSLIMLKTKYPDYQFLYVWDGKSKRRMIESKQAVEKGLIKSAYKENREKEKPQPLLDFYAQSLYLKKAIEQTGIPQIRLMDYEADDVIASYCRLLGKDNEIICVTGDDDYSVLLDNTVFIFDGMKQELITKENWELKYKIKPQQYIDCGALSGDDSDNIFGVPGIGDKTALKEIQKHGSWEKVLFAYKEQIDKYREQFPDLINNEAEFKRLQGIVTDSGKPKYPEILITMPYTGVALAIEDKKIRDKIPKTTILALMFEERIKLAYSLKQIDDIENLPPIIQGQFNKRKLIEYFDYYDIESLKESVGIFGG